MNFQIKNRYNGEVQFECELSAEVAGQEYGLQLGFAVKKAVEAKADLRSADLSYADLRSVKADVWMILLHAIPEAPALLSALQQGRVNGSTYSGECACLVGTIANARHVDATTLTNGLKPDSNRPAERFFLAIKEGDTPETNPASAIAAEWVSEFLALVSPPATVPA